MEIGKEKNDYKYVGQVKDAKTGEIGTYIPLANKNGGGLFILNTATGEGWWTNGTEWKPFDKPSEANKTEQKDSAEEVIRDNIDLPFVNDPQVIGEWQSTDFVSNISDFNVDKPAWKEKLFLEGLMFLENGKTAKEWWTWTHWCETNLYDYS